VTAYQKLEPGSATFRDIAFQCIQDKNASQLESLLAFYRQAEPDDANDASWDVELCRLKKDYGGALKLLTEHRDDLQASPQFKWQYDSYTVRCLLQLKQNAEALQHAEAVAKRKTGNRVLLVLVEASSGNVKKTISAVNRLGATTYLLEDCYRDEDLGPILRSDAFREFRERYPEPKPGADRFDDDFIDD
jgi:hypothetical protein